jgi:hypothetical protein
VWEPDAVTPRLRHLTGVQSALVADRTRLKNRIHSILAGLLVALPEGGLFTAKGLAWVRAVALPADARGTVVRGAAADWHRRRAEVFVPLAHPPGEAQVDFGQARAVIAGEPVTAALFVFALPHSDAAFPTAFPRAALLDRRALHFSAGVHRQRCLTRAVGSRGRGARVGTVHVCSPHQRGVPEWPVQRGEGETGEVAAGARVQVGGRGEEAGDEGEGESAGGRRPRPAEMATQTATAADELRPARPPSQECCKILPSWRGSGNSFRRTIRSTVRTGTSRIAATRSTGRI